MNIITLHLLCTYSLVIQISAVICVLDCFSFSFCGLIYFIYLYVYIICVQSMGISQFQSTKSMKMRTFFTLDFESIIKKRFAWARIVRLYFTIYILNDIFSSLYAFVFTSISTVSLICIMWE